MAAPSMTFNTAGNALASGSLGAGATTTFDIDLSAVFEGQLTIKNTPATLAATRGLSITVLPLYGSGPTVTTIGRLVDTLPSAAAAAESQTYYLSTGKYRVSLTNLDATNAITVEATLDTVDDIA